MKNKNNCIKDKNECMLTVQHKRFRKMSVSTYSFDSGRDFPGGNLASRLGCKQISGDKRLYYR